MNLELIHEDFRGRINRLVEGFKSFSEVTIFETKAGFCRGGCIHRLSDESVTVLEGEIVYVTPEGYFTLGRGENFQIPKNTPHYFLSKTDSVVLEWGPKEEEKKEKHADFRQIVDNINHERLTWKQ